MRQQTIRQQARRTAREIAGKQRRERDERERRVVSLAEQVMVAIGERDTAVAATEQRAGEALSELTEVEGLSMREAVRWCGETITMREATRLRRLAAPNGTEEGKDDGAVDEQETGATAEGGGGGDDDEMER